MNPPIKCPKCSLITLRPTILTTIGREYFCSACHEFFGLIELVVQWNYDAGDLFGNKPAPQKSFYCEYADGEPLWFSLAERQDAYQMVNRMLLGISELDDYMDLKATQMGALQ